MKETQAPSMHRLFVERLFTRLGLGMRAKLIILFIIIKVVPLVLLALVAWQNASKMGSELNERTVTLTKTLDDALGKTGEIAVNDAVAALNQRATEDIERVTTDIARQVANFLYARDGDIRLAASLKPDARTYRAFVDSMRANLVRPGEWELDAEGKRWVPVNRKAPGEAIASSIPENDLSFNYRSPDGFAYESRPLFLEMTFIGLDGKERVKVTTSERMDPALKDVSDRANTYVKAEDYFSRLQALEPGEIYVSEVVGAYVGSRVIGIYTPEAAAKAGEEFRPEASAYAGRENPKGERFKGLVRWAMPVVENGKKTGYVTLALDHDHLMSFTDHIVPTSERYSEIPDAAEGNYAFIWDHKGRSITHPRHFSIAGYDSRTGDPHVPWLEDRIYDAWQASGQPYAEFIRDVPTFVEQSTSKKPAAELTRQGFVGLDCRYLNFAPQCTGWFDLTRDGGSGSFVILWSGLEKLTTAAAIPYHTGQYAVSKRGFGFVTVGAGMEFFHGPAKRTQKVIDELIEETDKELYRLGAETQSFIDKNVLATATSLAISTGLMAVLVIFIAIWMASSFTRSITTMITGISRFRSGERHFRFNSPVKDEMGVLADSFDDMADSIVDSVKTPLVITDAERTILYMNDLALARVGAPLEEVVGKPYINFSPHSEFSPYNPITALLEGREAGVYPGEDGRLFQDKAAYLTDKEGRPIGIVITTSDVTEIVSGQMRIEEQRALLDTIVSSSPDLIWYKGGDGRYIMVNPRFSRIIGKDPEDMIGFQPEDVFSHDVAASLREKDRLAVELREPYYSEETFEFHDGHVEVLDSVRTPIFDPIDGSVSILGVSRNVTGRVETEQTLRKVQAELEEAVLEANKANESKSEFLARMSHEIRTPMNAIIGMANIVRRKLDNGPAEPRDLKANILQIETSSQHLLGLINDILDISKIEAGKIELSMEVLDLPHLVNSVADIIRPRCAEKNIEFTVSVETGGEKWFVSDPLRLRQVLINLLGNAVKFTPECGRIEFSIVCEEQDDRKAWLSFAVRDNGIGMSAEVMDKLFKPFEQGNRRITRQYGGTGLGLSISKSIVRLMGADIVVESEEGSGSSFSFTVWLQKAMQPERAEEVRSDSVSLKGRRVLLVDDVAVNRMIVADLLEPTGLWIDEAEDGSVAVEMVRRSPEGYYDVILMDVQMPIMDGYEAAAQIRALERDDTRVMPIIAMTANAFKEDVERAFASGMSGHMAKPLEFEKIIQTIVSQLAGRDKD